MQRAGRKNDPTFRVVVAEHTTAPQSGKFVEKLGSYHPKTKHFTLDSERVKYWLSVGAQASDRVHNVLISEGIIEGAKRNVLPKKTPVVKEDSAEEATTTEAGEGAGESGTVADDEQTDASAQDGQPQEDTPDDSTGEHSEPTPEDTSENEGASQNEESTTEDGGSDDEDEKSA